MQRVYLDNAATTRMLPEALQAMLPYYTDLYGNPSGFHSFSREAHKGLDDARRVVARCLKAREASEITFVSGGSEGNNMILRGIAQADRRNGCHIVTTAIEHHAVLRTLAEMERQGMAKVTYLPVDRFGMVDPAQVKEAIRQDTALVSVMFANNEVGTIQPVSEIAAVCREAGVLFHTDAVQAVGHIPVDVQSLGVDLLTLTAHKFHGPKGIGAVYIRKGIRVAPFIFGGEQENRKRAGTENVPGAVGLAAALMNQVLNMAENTARVIRLRDRLITGIEERIPFASLNGHRRERLPGNVNFCFRDIDSESLLLLLDRKGIAASSGSACTSGALDPSHVLIAMGVPPRAAKGSLRLTLSALTSDEDVDYTLETLPGIVETLRSRTSS